MTCCDNNAPEGGCNQGRDCPNRKPIDIGAAWRYACGYVPIILQYRDHKAAKHAGRMCAITPKEPAGIEFVGREPLNWQLIGYVAIVIVVTAFAYLWATQP
jgi:hypothetical protein